MSKSKKKTLPKRGSKPSGSTKTVAQTSTSSHNVRETIESIVIAFVLAFLFRTFEAEAFVIPTGSMAPTLQGRHKDVECFKCGYRYQASASREEDKQVQGLRGELARASSQQRVDFMQHEIELRDVVATTCPICRYSMSVDVRPETRTRQNDPEVQDGMRNASYNGDRIIVSKFAYGLGEPDRFDVIVFKFPGDAKMNYIKRLVGKPGETVRIHQGDLYVKPDGEDDFSIIRKPPGKVLAMMQIVHDQRYRPADLDASGWPLRWQARSSTNDADNADEHNWQVSPTGEAVGGGRVYSIDGIDPEPRWIRYRHYVPSWDDWKRIERGPPAESDIARVRPQLITDFYAYNTDVERRTADRQGRGLMAARLGYHWVGDLVVECDLAIRGDSGEVLLSLVEAGKTFECRIDVATGRATLGIEGLAGFAPTAATPISGPGSHRLRLANVDDQLLLWVDERLAEFSSPTTYEATDVFADASRTEPTTSDLAPVGVGSRGASLEVTGLRVFRDTYYIAARPGGPMVDYDLPGRFEGDRDPNRLVDFLSDPSQWHVFADRRSVEFPLVADPVNSEKDQFFVLGDNSPSSLDGRLWGPIGQHFVERRLLIGKAMFIYWPHSWGKVPGTSIPLPMFPNFSDMGMIR